MKTLRMTALGLFVFCLPGMALALQPQPAPAPAKPVPAVTTPGATLSTRAAAQAVDTHLSANGFGTASVKVSPYIAKTGTWAGTSHYTGDLVGNEAKLVEPVQGRVNRTTGQVFPNATIQHKTTHAPLEGMPAPVSKIQFPRGLNAETESTISTYVGKSGETGNVRVVVDGDHVSLESMSTFTGGPKPGADKWEAFAGGTLKDGKITLAPIDRGIAPVVQDGPPRLDPTTGKVTINTKPQGADNEFNAWARPAGGAAASKIQFPGGLSPQAEGAVSTYVGKSGQTGTVRVVISGDHVSLMSMSTFTGGPKPGADKWEAFAGGTFKNGQISGLSPIDRGVLAP